MAKIEETLLTDIKHRKDIFEQNGDLVLESGLDNVKTALLRRLITTPGSLIHRPEYGVGMKSFQNAPNSIDNQRELAFRIKENFERDERVLEVLGTLVTVDDLEPEKTKIRVRVRIVGFSDAIDMGFIPFGGETF